MYCQNVRPGDQIEMPPPHRKIKTDTLIHHSHNQSFRGAMSNPSHSVKRVVSNPDEMGRDHAKISKTCVSSLPNDQACIAMGSISITDNGHDVNVEEGANLIANQGAFSLAAGNRNNTSPNDKGEEDNFVIMNGREFASSSQQRDSRPISAPGPNAKTSIDEFVEDEVNKKGKIRRQVSADGNTMREKTDPRTNSLIPGSRNSSGSSRSSNPGNWGWFDEVHFDEKGKGSPTKESDNLKPISQSSGYEIKGKDEFSIDLRKQKGAFTQNNHSGHKSHSVMLMELGTTFS
jgi:hypothetical protein